MLQTKIINSISQNQSDDFSVISISNGAYELEALSKKIKRIIINEGHFTEVNYPFTIKPNFSTLGSIIEVSSQGPLISFLPDDSKRNILGFNATTLYDS